MYHYSKIENNFKIHAIIEINKSGKEGHQNPIDTLNRFSDDVFFVDDTTKHN